MIAWVQEHFTTAAQREAFEASFDVRSFLPVVVEIVGPSLMLITPNGQNRIIGHMELAPGALTPRDEALIREHLKLGDKCIASVIDAVRSDVFLDERNNLVRDLSVVLGCKCHDGVQVIRDV